MNLKMIICPKCGNEFPEKRRELGYHVCINCSSEEPVVGITTVEGSGDHTYNDIIIMKQSQARAIAKKAGELTGKKVNLEVLDFDKDEAIEVQSQKEKLDRLQDDDVSDEDEHEDEDPEGITGEVEGIDY
jgi:formylmethanofuran dehydrogenase subunit E|tara:strand:- start:26 stop:415 length:390 start_codon:yes stop_codon:yes gene_type:complete